MLLRWTKFRSMLKTVLVVEALGVSYVMNGNVFEIRWWKLTGTFIHSGQRVRIEGFRRLLNGCVGLMLSDVVSQRDKLAFVIDGSSGAWGLRRACIPAVAIDNDDLKKLINVLGWIVNVIQQLHRVCELCLLDACIYFDLRMNVAGLSRVLDCWDLRIEL